MGREPHWRESYRPINEIIYLSGTVLQRFGKVREKGNIGLEFSLID